MHTLVTAQVRELCVRFEAHLALERFHRRMDVCVLLQAGLGGKCFTTLGTGMASGANVTIANVSLQIRWVGEYLWRARGNGNILIIYLD